MYLSQPSGQESSCVWYCHVPMFLCSSSSAHSFILKDVSSTNTTSSFGGSTSIAFTSAVTVTFHSSGPIRSAHLFSVILPSVLTTASGTSSGVTFSSAADMPNRLHSIISAMTSIIIFLALYDFFILGSLHRLLEIDSAYISSFLSKQNKRSYTILSYYIIYHNSIIISLFP